MKTKIVQFRIEPELMERFQMGCESRYAVPSQILRKYIIDTLERWDRIEKDRHPSRLQAPQAVSKPVPDVTPVPAVKSPPAPSRAVRRAKEKEDRRDR